MGQEIILDFCRPECSDDGYMLGLLLETSKQMNAALSFFWEKPLNWRLTPNFTRKKTPLFGSSVFEWKFSNSEENDHKCAREKLVDLWGKKKQQTKSPEFARKYIKTEICGGKKNLTNIQGKECQICEEMHHKFVRKTITHLRGIKSKFARKKSQEFLGGKKSQIC